MKYTQYAYLVAAVFLFYDTYIKINSGNDMPYLTFFLGLGAVAMFFFRRNFAKKFEKKDNNLEKNKL
ncbi:hypothetical protein B0A78_01440 [Flavobacterium columnare NBRC 100251 = ATCC 23463]|uniref:Uncharacterized protein n=2 Tax=Flavobacterium columnare TaxID=996 RepID=G8X7J6_FLACA|nr:hypothetical protein FCOL_04375 [Flavobacterium columnare ATCC 49512]PDS26699.1 hypothetical protein B0A78_01440 [Flavobacterium columnare NBRC 100251 = ATCC 23463]